MTKVPAKWSHESAAHKWPSAPRQSEEDGGEDSKWNGPLVNALAKETAVIVLGQATKLLGAVEDTGKCLDRVAQGFTSLRRLHAAAAADSPILDVRNVGKSPHARC